MNALRKILNGNKEVRYAIFERLESKVERLERKINQLEMDRVDIAVLKQKTEALETESNTKHKATHNIARDYHSSPLLATTRLMKSGDLLIETRSKTVTIPKVLVNKLYEFLKGVNENKEADILRGYL